MREEHEQGSQTSVRGGAGNGLNRAPASELARQPHADASNSWPPWVNIGKDRKRAKKGTGSSASVQDIARRVREWVIQKPPSAKHSAWRWGIQREAYEIIEGAMWERPMRSLR
jgi:hypothetical protein